MEGFTLSDKYMADLKARVASGEISQREAKSEIMRLMVSVLR